jgi:multidrug efflux system membrane fusion protein
MRINNLRRFITAETLSAILILLLVSFTGCGKKSGPPPKKDAVPVIVAPVTQKTMPLQIESIGNVEAYSTVSIKAQSGGVLSQIHFKEGQDVKKGDILFTIDTRSYHAQLKQAEATLAKDMAQLENAAMEVKRYDDLIKKGYVAQSEYDKVITNASVLEAIAKADKAAVENTRLLLDYCVIRSPITGRTGDLMAHEGDLIKANADTAMLVINQIQPVYVNFAVAERYLIEIKKYSSGKISVDAVIPGDEKHPENGTLSFIDNAVDTTTGTIRLKATFANAARHLWPGQFVNTAMTLIMENNAILVPSRAIQSGQQGSFVFVVKPDLTVEIRPVTVKRTVRGEAIIEKGVQSGETVVTDGQLRLTPGAKVEIKKDEKTEKPVQEKSK